MPRLAGPLTAVALLVGMATVAYADNVVNNVDTSVDPTREQQAVAVGGSAGVKISVLNTIASVDGASGNNCNLSGGTSTTITLAIASADTAIATVSPAQVTIDDCDSSAGGANAKTVVVSGVANGTVDINVTLVSATTSNGGSFNLAPAQFQAVVGAGVPDPVDTTAPVITYELNPSSPDGDNGWYRSSVTLTWTVTEDESLDSLVKTGCVDQAITADQQETTYSCSAESDGGSAGPVEVKIKRDGSEPDVDLVGGPAAGGSYYFGSVPGAPTCTASDATSGLADADNSAGNGQTDCAISGYSTAVGSHTVSANAADRAGNINSDSRTYEVLAWTLNGFYQPVDMGALNIVKGGATVPLKFEVFAGTTELTETAVVDTFRAYRSDCAGTPTGTDEIEQYTSGATILRYDATGGQFIQNWQVPKGAGVCFHVVLTLDDGSSIAADFKTK